MVRWRWAMLVLTLIGGQGAGQSAPPAALTRYEDPKSPTAESSGLKLTAGPNGGELTLTLAGKALCRGACDTLLTLTAPTSSTAGGTQRATLDALDDAFTIRTSTKWTGDIPRTDLLGVWGLTGEVGRKDHSYFDETTLTAATATRTPYGISLFGGASQSTKSKGNQDVRWFFKGQFKFQNATQDRTSEIKCLPPGAGLISCVGGPIGAPISAISRIWSFEGRYVGPKFHAGPILSYDSVTRVKGLYIPFYLVGPEQQEKKEEKKKERQRQGKNGATPVTSPSFNAGIDLGWTSDDRKWRIGLFVGSTIDSFFSND